jgi:hypothetical protein
MLEQKISWSIWYYEQLFWVEKLGLVFADKEAYRKEWIDKLDSTYYLHVKK